MRKTTEAQKRASIKHIQNLDEFKIRFAKGSKEEIRKYAEMNSESINSFFLRAVRETMQRDVENRMKEEYEQ